MFNNGKKKIIFTDVEVKLLLLALNNFRSSLIKEKEYTDGVDDILIKLKSKMKVDKNELGIMMLSLDKYNGEITENVLESIENLKSKIIEVYKLLNK